MTNLNEITWYNDDVDRWAAATEFVLRQRAYRSAIIAASLTGAIEGWKRVGESFAVAGEVYRRAEAGLLELNGIPLDMQREVMAITRERRTP